MFPARAPSTSEDREGAVKHINIKFGTCKKRKEKKNKVQSTIVIDNTDFTFIVIVPVFNVKTTIALVRMSTPY